MMFCAYRFGFEDYTCVIRLLLSENIIWFSVLSKKCLLILEFHTVLFLWGKCCHFSFSFSTFKIPSLSLSLFLEKFVFLHIQHDSCLLEMSQTIHITPRSCSLSCLSWTRANRHVFLFSFFLFW
jgi:hypothetical protein